MVVLATALCAACTFAVLASSHTHIRIRIHLYSKVRSFALIVLLVLFSAASAFRLPSPASQAVREHTRAHVLKCMHACVRAYVHTYITLYVDVCIDACVCLRDVSLACSEDIIYLQIYYAIDKERGPFRCQATLTHPNVKCRMQSEAHPMYAWTLR
jgi:hypothetical protein